MRKRFQRFGPCPVYAEAFEMGQGFNPRKISECLIGRRRGGIGKRLQTVEILQIVQRGQCRKRTFFSDCRYLLFQRGISLLGGEPFEPENQRELLPFVRNFRALYPNKSVWCYSGYTWEQLTGSVPCPARCEVTDELLSLLDVLVDGRFVEAQHDISLRFRGSSNQRLLDVPKSLAAKAPVWWEDEQVFATHSMER